MNLHQWVGKEYWLMKQIDVYRFDELPKDAQDYVFENYDRDPKLRGILDIVSQWEENGADAQWQIDVEIALDFADNKDLKVNEDYIKKLEFNWKNIQDPMKLEWSKIFEDVVFWDDDSPIYLEFENNKNDLKIVRSISDRQFDKLSSSMQRGIKEYESNAKEFAKILTDAKHDAIYYAIPEDDLLYALNDIRYDFIITEEGKVVLL